MSACLNTAANTFFFSRDTDSSLVCRVMHIVARLFYVSSWLLSEGSNVSPNTACLGSVEVTSLRLQQLCQELPFSAASVLPSRIHAFTHGGVTIVISCSGLLLCVSVATLTSPALAASVLPHRVNVSGQRPWSRGIAAATTMEATFGYATDM